MERTECEPNVISYDKKRGESNFYDCSSESPKDRRSVFFLGICIQLFPLSYRDVLKKTGKILFITVFYQKIKSKFELRKTFLLT
jgi:hypothetical protein